MNLIMLGIDFPHAKGEFCYKTVLPHYTICRFSTPFVYWHNGQLMEGAKGDFLINSPGQVVYHGPCDGAEKGFVNDWLHVGGSDFAARLAEYPIPQNRAFYAECGVTFRRIQERLSDEFRAVHTGRATMIDCLLTEMVVTLHRAVAEWDANRTPYASVAAVKSAIRQNPEKKWTLAQMAAASGYSVSRFCELYGQMYGTSPQNDVIGERLRMAKLLLASGQTSVTYVAHASGFGTINFFSIYCKKAEGCTPTEFMNTVHRNTK